MNDFPVRIYAVNVSPLEDALLFEKAYRKVTEARRKKTDQIRSHVDKCRSLGAELLLLYGLSQMGILREDGRMAEVSSPKSCGSVMDLPDGHGKAAESSDKACTVPGPEMDFPRFHYGENGKPYLDGVKDLYFNVSHSGELAVCAIAPCEVGCDVEKIRDRKTAVARRFFAPAEYEAICSQENAEARQRLFFRFWTLKESFLKVTGEGLRLGLDSFQIIPGEKKISVIQNVDHRAYYFKEYEAAEGYCCAVCAVQETFEAQVHRVNIKELLNMR